MSSEYNKTQENIDHVVILTHVFVGIFLVTENHTKYIDVVYLHYSINNIYIPNIILLFCF